ncbi:MAG: hypothetical protein RR255_00445 [Bacilli bacterium]
MLRLKDGINPSILEKYGFEIGQNFVNRGKRCVYNEYATFDDYRNLKTTRKTMKG